MSARVGGVTLSDSPSTHCCPRMPVGHSAKELKPGGAFQWSGRRGGRLSRHEAMKRMTLIVGDMALSDSLSNREEPTAGCGHFLTVDSASGANVFACQSGSATADIRCSWPSMRPTVPPPCSPT